MGTSTAGKKASTTIKVPLLARVEGEGGIVIKLRGDQVKDVKFKIFEPPRMFEAFLRGRQYTEVPDITARICGICPIAYQMSSVHALERALGIDIDPMVRLLRRLFYCGEWIESHTLHIYLLHAPDFLGFQDAFELAAKHRDVVEKGLRLKKIGNDLVALIGGREIHPVSAAVGGFHKVPGKHELAAIRDDLKWALEASVDTVKLVSSFDFLEFTRDYEFVSLSHPSEYPFNEGRIISGNGLDIDAAQFEDHFVERHVKHSTALHAALRERGAYFVGPMARFNLNFDKLPAAAKQAAADSGLPVPCRNPFQSIVVRAIETVFACEEALRIIDAYEPPSSPRATFKVRASTGHAATEAPRGLLYHRYSIDEQGAILTARIIPPTSQNQRQIEEDLWNFVSRIASEPVEKITWQCEQAVRNYDPCISCSVHCLKVRVERK